MLLLDCGDAFNARLGKFPELESDAIFKAMAHMKYDAMNVAENDLNLRPGFFQELSKTTSIHLLSATLKGPDSHGLVYHPYVVKAFGDIRIGIVGATASVLLRGDMLISWETQMPEEEIGTLRNIISEVRKKADRVVFLSHYGYYLTLHMVRTGVLDGVDVAIVGHGVGILDEPIFENGIIVVQNSVRGEYLGALELNFDESRNISGYDGKLIPIAMDIPEDAWTVQLLKELEGKMKTGHK